MSFREGEPITYTTYDDMEKDFVSGKVREREGKGQKDAKKRRRRYGVKHPYATPTAQENTSAFVSTRGVYM